MLPGDEADYLAVQGDITARETMPRVVQEALDRFRRIDSLINNAGVFISKPFTDYGAEDFAAVTGVTSRVALCADAVPAPCGRAE
jgi:NADP-dependent 3-hydroxy acid dehydrogenase YdfG